MNLEKVICICTAAATIASLGTCASVMAADGKDYKIAVVPKMTNIAWFQRMDLNEKLNSSCVLSQ